MWLLILEALIALSLLCGAVWWTMFSGRRRDAEPEEPDDPDPPPQPKQHDPPRDPPHDDGPPAR